MGCGCVFGRFSLFCADRLVTPTAHAARGGRRRYGRPRGGWDGEGARADARHADAGSQTVRAVHFYSATFMDPILPPPSSAPYDLRTTSCPLICACVMQSMDVLFRRLHDMGGTNLSVVACLSAPRSSTYSRTCVLRGYPDAVARTSARGAFLQSGGGIAGRQPRGCPRLWRLPTQNGVTGGWNHCRAQDHFLFQKTYRLPAVRCPLSAAPL